MNTNEILALAAKLESAYKAEDNLKANTEVLAKEARAFIRSALVEYFSTKEMLLAIANKTGLRGSHTIYQDIGWRTPHCSIRVGNVHWTRLEFEFNGVLANCHTCGPSTYGDFTKGTRYTDLRLNCGDSDRDLGYSIILRSDWVDGKSGEEALKYFDTHIWTAQGYVNLKKDAEIVNRYTERMKECFAAYADEITRNESQELRR